MAKDYNSAELCLNAVQALEEQLRGARKTLINSETCVVNRGIMTAQLEYLKERFDNDEEVQAAYDLIIRLPMLNAAGINRMIERFNELSRFDEYKSETALELERASN